MVNFLKKLVFRVYVILLMAFTVWYGYFMYPLIFGFEGKEEAEASLKELGQAGTDEERLFVKLIATQEETKKIDLGYRVIEQPYIEGRFHHIGFHVDEDKSNTCVSCHGNVPHNKSKEIRSFLNMHAFYTACQTCHIQPDEAEEGYEFRWYDTQTGDQTVNPTALVEIEQQFARGDEDYYPVYGNYDAKIAPGEFTDNVFIFIKGGASRELVERYNEQEKQLSTQKKSQMIELIHNKITKQPVICTECHNSKDPYLPFAQLGYPPRRVEELTNSSVVGMIEKYKEFFLPSFVSPVSGMFEEAGGDTPEAVQD